jgi:hypothetical protein
MTLSEVLWIVSAFVVVWATFDLINLITSPDFYEAYNYIRDPHAWHAQARWLRYKKFTSRPGVVIMGNDILVHPAIEQKIRDELATPPETLGNMFWMAPTIFVDVNVVNQPPPNGWEDIVLPQRPRLAP